MWKNTFTSGYDEVVGNWLTFLLRTTAKQEGGKKKTKLLESMRKQPSEIVLESPGCQREGKFSARNAPLNNLPNHCIPRNLAESIC